MELNESDYREEVDFLEEIKLKLKDKSRDLLVESQVLYEKFPVDLVISDYQTKTRALIEAKYNATAVSLSSIVHLVTARDMAAHELYDWGVRAVLVVKMRRGRPKKQFLATRDLAKQLGVDLVLISHPDQAVEEIGKLLRVRD